MVAIAMKLSPMCRQVTCGDVGATHCCKAGNDDKATSHTVARQEATLRQQTKDQHASKHENALPVTRVSHVKHLVQAKTTRNIKAFEG